MTTGGAATSGASGESTGTGSTTGGSSEGDDSGSSDGGERCAAAARGARESFGEMGRLVCLCGPETRKGGVCTREYKPVCGSYADASTETFPNKCVACSDLQVDSYVDGPCPSGGDG